MRISQLPPAYQQLAKQRTQECKNGNTFEDTINGAFVWSGTPEGIDFWLKCYEAKTESELPPIPATTEENENPTH